MHMHDANLAIVQNLTSSSDTSRSNSRLMLSACTCMTHHKYGHRLKPYLFFRHISVELQVDALSMSSHNWHSYTRCCDVDIVVAPDLLRLLHHLHLFFIVAVLCHWAVVAEQVEGILQYEMHIIHSLIIGFVAQSSPGPKLMI